MTLTARAERISGGSSAATACRRPASVRSGTDSVRSRHSSGTSWHLPSVGCISSMCCSRAGAASAAESASRSVRPVLQGSCGVYRLAVSAVGRLGHGPSVVAPSAVAGGWRLRARAPQSCTKKVPEPSLRRGRSVGDATWQPWPPISSSRPWRGRSWTSSRSFPAIAIEGLLEATPLLLRWPPSSPRPGRSHWQRCCSAGRVSSASATCPGPTGAGMWPGCSRPAGRPPGACASWTTSTRRGRRRQRARLHSVEREPGGSTSCVSRGRCGE